MFRDKPIEKKNQGKFDLDIKNASWGNYYFQYKCIIDHIVKGVEGKELQIGVVYLPLMFSIRHCLELGLKDNILELEKVNPTLVWGKIMNTHSLVELHNKFSKHLEEILKNHKISPEIREGIESYQKDLKQIIDALHVLDKGSYNFRYPVNKEGEANFKRLPLKKILKKHRGLIYSDHINISNIINCFYKIDKFLDHTIDVLWDQGVFYQAEFEAKMKAKFEAEMKAYYI